jgi:hypothetical protein
VNQRQFGIRKQSETASAGGSAIAAEGVERSDHKSRRGDQRDAQDAAAGAVPNAAQAERDQPADDHMSARVQPGRLEQQSGDEQQRARAEETGCLAERDGNGGAHHRGARCEPSPPRGPARRLARQQTARRDRVQAAQRPRHGSEARGDAGSGSHGQRGNGGVQRNQPGPHGVEPPSAQPQQDERAVCQRHSDTGHRAGRGQRRAFEQKQGPDLRCRKPERAQHADFARPLFDAELEEQAREQQRRNHQEETEVHEVLAKVSRPLRRLEALGSHGDDGEAG